MPEITKERRRLCSLLFLTLIAALSLMAVLLACATATAAGYSAWYKRLLYFTQQSNLWVGITAALSVLFDTRVSNHTRVRAVLRTFRYIFAVSITLTGVIFCALLAPFAEEDIWSFSSVLTHVAVPLLCVAHLLLLEERAPLARGSVPLALLPPALYYLVALLLGACGVDFGRGVNYPYFFMNTASGVPLFGASIDGPRPVLGMGWWLIVLFVFVLGVALLYARLHPHRRRPADRS